jgi:hypothetical protein
MVLACLAVLSLSAPCHTRCREMSRDCSAELSLELARFQVMLLPDHTKGVSP